jgi:excisionase family DNA binding protein
MVPSRPLSLSGPGAGTGPVTCGPNTPQDALRTSEAALKLGVHADTVRKWARSGLLRRSTRVGPGRRLRIHPDDVAELIASCAPADLVVEEPQHGGGVR